MRVMLALLVFLGAALLGDAAGAQTLPTADELQARARDAAGPVPDNYRETVVGTGSLGTTRTTTFRIGKDIRHTFDRGPIHNEWGTYQGQDWRQDGNGLTVAILADPRGEKSDTLTKTVTHVTAPVDAYVVTTMNVRSAGSRVYYDTKTFHLIRRDDVNSTGTVTTTYSEWSTFGARSLPRVWTVASKASGLQMRYERTEYTADAATADDVRVAGTQRRLVEFPPGVTKVVLPAKFVGSNVIVRLSIGSRNLDFELDTGSSTIFLDTGVARSLGLNLINQSSAVAAGRFTGYAAIVPEIDVGSLKMRNIAVAVGPMPDLPMGDVKPVGLLGFDFLAQLGVTVDYPGGRLTVSPADDYVPPASPPAMPFDVRLGNGVPVLTVKVEGNVADHMAFDTGWFGFLGFFDYFARRYPQVFHHQVNARPGYAIVGVGGMNAVTYYQFRDVTVGPIDFTDLVGARVPISSFPGSMDGVIGNSIISAFVLDLDYTHGRVYLTPSEALKHDMKAR